MRAKFFIGLIMAGIIGSGYAAELRRRAQETPGYWKPSKGMRTGSGNRQTAGLAFREAPIGLRSSEDVMYNNGVEFLTNKKFSQAISEFDKLINDNRRYADAITAGGWPTPWRANTLRPLPILPATWNSRRRTSTPTATGAWPGSSRANMTRAWLTLTRPWS